MERETDMVCLHLGGYKRRARLSPNWPGCPYLHSFFLIPYFPSVSPPTPTPALRNKDILMVISIVSSQPTVVKLTFTERL